MLDMLFGGNGHGHGHGRKDRRGNRRDDSDSDSDVEEHKVSRFIGDVAEHVAQPFEIATKMVVNPVHNLLYSSPKQGKKGKQGRHEDAYHGGQKKQPHNGQKMQHHSGHGDAYNGAHGMKYQDRLMAPK